MVEGIQVGCGAINDTKVVATVDEVRGSDDCWANHENLARGPPPERARCHWPRHEHRVFWQFLERPAKGQPPGHVFLSVAVVKTMLSCTKSHSNVLLLKTRLRRPGHETRDTRSETRDVKYDVIQSSYNQRRECNACIDSILALWRFCILSIASYPPSHPNLMPYFRPIQGRPPRRRRCPNRLSCLS